MSTPTEFLIEAMEEMDDVDLILIVLKHKDGSISYDTNTHSGWDSHALAVAVDKVEFAKSVVARMREEP